MSKNSTWTTFSKGSGKPRLRRGPSTQAPEKKATARSLDENPPLTASELQAMKKVSIAKRARWATSMSQEEFAAALLIPVGTLRDWEQHRSEPDSAALTLLKMIQADPKGSLKVLQKVTALPA